MEQEQASAKRSSRKRRVEDFRHPGAKRRNNPPAGIAPTYESRKRQTRQYAYDPHLDPQLIWAGKAEHTSFEVDVVPLHIHERISTRAILNAVRRPQPPQLDLFGETPLPVNQQIEFYRHEVGWANRLILGDSLLVMNSLLVKECMAGKVQMIYVDPPYGIKYASNFQPRIDRRDVKDKDEDLTHEPEQIKAYRDTWTLGIHSYLTYLRDRLLLCRELLTESGSIFVQINDENLHLVRCLLDEVFGRENFVAVVPFTKTRAVFEAKVLRSICDYLLWYAKSKAKMKYQPTYVVKDWRKELGVYTYVLHPDGTVTSAAKDPSAIAQAVSHGAALFKSDDLIRTPNPEFEALVNGRRFLGRWRTNPEGMRRLALAERLFAPGNQLRYIYRLDDFPAKAMENIWLDTIGEPEKLYAVQTNTKVVERCILMTTDPGDLVFDPTCGSGTTAWCAEKWGRRWITCDTSRVALAIARQRLMTAKFDYYELHEPKRGPAGGFNYETVPHITLESIAKNDEIDAIADTYQPQIDQALADLNRALGKDWKEWEVPREVPHPIWPQEARDAYARLRTLKDSLGAEDQEEARRLLELIYQRTGHRWELNAIPDPMPPEGWLVAAKDALRRFWELKRQKREEIDKSIQHKAPQETLYDRPKVVRGVVRVTGPFTVEAIPVPAVEDPTQATIPQSEDSVGAGSRASPDAGQPQGDAPTTEPGRINDRGGDYLTTMSNLLKKQGSILFPRGKRLHLANIQPLNLGYLHAEAEGAQNGERKRVAVSFGPQYGPVTASQTDEAIRIARRAGYDILILAGFSIEASAQAIVQEAKIPGLDVHFANVAPDVLMQVEETQGKVSLLKTTRASQIFTVFGQPDVRVDKQEDGTYRVELSGVDIYDPLTGEVQSTRGEDVAAWFLDTDYDGKTFHICQAFFPGDPDAWEKLQRALKAQILPEVFKQMHGTVSFPFQLGEHQRIAVKVIDFRGNEVIRVIPLNA